MSGIRDFLCQGAQTCAPAEEYAFGTFGAQTFGQRQTTHEMASANLRVSVGAEENAHGHSLSEP